MTGSGSIHDAAEGRSVPASLPLRRPSMWEIHPGRLAIPTPGNPARLAPPPLEILTSRTPSASWATTPRLSSPGTPLTPSFNQRSASCTAFDTAASSVSTTPAAPSLSAPQSAVQTQRAWTPTHWSPETSGDKPMGVFRHAAYVAREKKLQRVQLVALSRAKRVAKLAAGIAAKKTAKASASQAAEEAAQAATQRAVHPAVKSPATQTAPRSADSSASPAEHEVEIAVASSPSSTKSAKISLATEPHSVPTGPPEAAKGRVCDACKPPKQVIKSVKSVKVSKPPPSVRATVVERMREVTATADEDGGARKVSRTYSETVETTVCVWEEADAMYFS